MLNNQEFKYRPEVLRWIKKTDFLGSYSRAEKAYEAIYRSEGIRAEVTDKKDGFQDKDEALKYNEKYSLKFARGGRCVELKRKLGKQPKGLEKKKKGVVIVGYSRESRNRLIRYLSSIQYEKMGRLLFGTLTYPGEYSNDPRVWKRDFKAFTERLKRRFPDVIIVWRLEPQKRGAPHFSMFIWNCSELETREGKKWFSKTWFEVVGSGDEKHIRSGTRIDIEKDLRKRIFYMGKYVTKKEKGSVPQEFDYPVGRYWGAVNRSKIKIEIENIEIDREIFIRVKRILRKILKRKLPKDKHRSAVKNKHNGIWALMPEKEILKCLNHVVNQLEDQEK